MNAAMRRKSFRPDERSRLCYQHFKADDFMNYGQWKSGYASVLKINPGAIPSGNKEETEEERMLSKREKRATLRDSLADTSALRNRTKVIYLPSKRVKPFGLNKNPTEIPAKCVSKGQQTRKTLMRAKKRSVAVQCDISSHQPVLPVPAAPVQDYASDSEDSIYLSESEDLASDDDADYEPSSSESEGEEGEEEHISSTMHGTFHGSSKIIVEEDNLDELLRVCRSCAGGNSIDKKRIGAYLEYETSCLDCNHSYSFRTTPKIGKYATINGMICGGILFNGAMTGKVFRVLKSINIALPSTRTYWNYQKNFLHGIIREAFQKDMEKVRGEVLSGGGGGVVDVAGDARCDTPGHSALYGTYSLMDVKTKKILAINTIKSTETSSSNAMELEGLQRSMRDLRAVDIRIGSLTTDRHPQIEGFMRKDQPAIVHLFDTWHVAKSLKKSLRNASQLSAFRKISCWIRPISNHLHYTITTTPPNTDLRREKWLSVINHCQDIHQHDFPNYQKCGHGPLPDLPANDVGKPMVRDYLIKDGMVAGKLESVIVDKRLLTAVMRCSPYETGELESFHSAINRNCPKQYSFSYDGMISRIQLSAIHHNENTNRDVKKLRNGMDKLEIVRNKHNKLTPTIFSVKEDATYDYRSQMFMQLEKCLEDVKFMSIPKLKPASLASTGEQMSKEDIIRRQTTRGLRKKHHIIPVDEVEVEGSRRKKKK